MGNHDSSNTNLTEKNQNTWSIQSRSENLYRANLSVLDKETVKSLTKHKEIEVPTEVDVEITGIKNPLCAVILGLSTSRVLDKLFESNKRIDHVIVIEPEIGRFHATLRRHMLAHHLNNEKIDFLVGIPMDELQFHLHECMSRFDKKLGSRANSSLVPEIIPDPFIYGAKGTHPMDAKALTSYVVGASNQVFQSMGCSADTYSRFHQVSRNFKNLEDCHSFKGLVDRFKDTPAICVGGGPSVEDFIKVCKKENHHKKSLIIAVDAVLRRLLKEGIKPHIVVRCERKLTYIFEGLTKEDVKGITYVAYPWCPPEFFDLFEDKVMVYRSNGICNWTGLPHHSLDAGVSSGNAVVETAWALGVKNCVVTGIDLCFINDKTHCDGTMVEFDPMKSVKLHSKIKGNNGKEVTTIPVWARCLNEFQNTMQKFKKKKPMNVYNTSLNGAYVHGFIVKPWSDLLYLFKKEIHPEKRLRENLTKINQKDKDSFEKKKAETIVFLDKVIKDLNELFISFDDSLNNNIREERKCMEQLKCVMETKEFFTSARKIEKSLFGVYKDPSTKSENLKSALYNSKLFTEILADTVQLDIFKTENRVRSINNLIECEHEKAKSHVNYHFSLFKLFKYYATEIKDLIAGNKINLENIDDDNSGMLSESFGQTIDFIGNGKEGEPRRGVGS